MYDNRRFRIALGLHILFDHYSAGVKNTYFSLKEQAHNAFSHDRRFQDMQEATGYIRPMSLYDDGYTMSAVNLLERDNTESGLSLSTRTISHESPAADTGVYAISMRDRRSFDNTIEMQVSGDTTNGDFFQLWDAISGAADFDEAKTIMATRAPTLLGDKLIETIDMKEKYGQPPPAATPTPSA